MNQSIRTTIFTVGTTLLILLSQWTQAAVLATVSTNKAAKGEVFLLKVVSDQRADSSDIDFSSLESDFYLGSPRFSSSLNSINGKRSIRSEWSLSLAPLRVGILTIPSFQVKGESTAPIAIQATIDSSMPKVEDLLSFETKLSKSELYPAEIAQLDTKLIIKTDVRRIQNPKLTAPTSVGPVDIEPIGDSHQYIGSIDGVEATIVEQSYRVTVSEAGLYDITGPTLSATILDNNNQTGSTRLIPINLEAKTIHIEVSEKPTNFKGSWLPSPNLNLTQKWLDADGSEVTDFAQQTGLVGSPITREITLTIDGIAQSQLPNIIVDYPDNVRFYEEPAKINQNGNQVSMTLKHVLIPKIAGQVTLPPISLHWWNTNKKQSETAKLTGATFAVEQSDTPTIKLDSSPQQAQPIATDTQTITIKDAGLWPYIAAFFAILWLLTLVILIKRPTIKQSKVAKHDLKPDTFNALLTAVKNHDGMATQSYLTEWYQQKPQLDLTTKQKINQQVQALMASIYANDSTPWKNDELLALLKKANKKTSNKNNDQDSLAPL
ncbi:BatD family protein [Vibrio sp. TH_r3]|uniref:BatD family protein n=1 Tax=Vibrio sp. TH_r3 TaxID=3082084 RepID=UPI002952B14F|nr:BatD family protein [Vibrio sp. TH_r3]MDV7103292.1 BatD family protein [Vibrio sp. TH_r3]